MLANPAYFYERTKAARKVIVVDLGFLGDTVHLVPALWELKRNYPAAALHVLTTPIGAQVLELAPCVERAWAIELDPAKRTLRQQWQILRGLRREHFDVAFNFSGADRTVFMTALIGARWRLGHAAGRWHFWNPWLVPTWVARCDPDLLVFEQRRQVLAACGLKLEPPRFDLKINAAALLWAEDVVPPFAIHISPNSSKETREWPLEHHVALLRAVWAEQPELRVLISGSAKPRERARLQALAAAVGDPRLQALSETLNIPQLAAMLARCRLHIGPDSGVLHLAMALDVPTISFFRQQGNYKSFMPVGARHRVISMPCRCVDHHEAACELKGRSDCFAQIEPAQVAALVRQQLTQTPGGDKLK